MSPEGDASGNSVCAGRVKALRSDKTAIARRMSKATKNGFVDFRIAVLKYPIDKRAAIQHKDRADQNHDRQSDSENVDPRELDGGYAALRFSWRRG